MKYLFYILSYFIFFQGFTQDLVRPLEKNKLVEKHYNIKINDPYRYSENLNDSSVINWINQNNIQTDNYFKKIEGEKKLTERILKSYEKKDSDISSTIITGNNLYFYLKTNPKENYSKLFYKEGKNGKEILVFDPKSYKVNDNIKYTINHISPCWAGEKVAVGITENDKEFSNIIVVDIKSRITIFETDKKSWPGALGGVKWNADCSGIYYTYVPVTDKSKKGYLFNTEAIYFDIENNEEKTVLFSKSNNPSISFKEEDFPLLYFDYHENQHIIGTVAGVAKYRDAYVASLKDISKNKKDWKPLFKISDKVRLSFLLKDELIYLTAKDASNFKICKTSIQNPDFTNPDILVPEYTEEIITSFTITKDGIYFVKVKNGVEAKLMFLDNARVLKQIDLPVKAGSISLQTKSPTKSDLWITIEGWANSSTKYFYDIESKSFTLEEETLELKQNDIIVEEVLVQSHDGKEIPLSLVYKKGFKKDGNCPLFITAYGAYGRSINPRSTVLISNWIDEGGVYAVAHVRGGGEKGYEWHMDGQKLNKANSWKDLISCVKYLQKQGYTKPKKTVAWGASAGGITVGRAVLEEPNLFSAVIITSGTLNTIRSEFAPNGKNNVKEFGTVENIEEFKSLLAMDSYHNLKKNTSYPAFLVTTGFNDARVASWQSTKFIARLKEYSISNKPILFAVDFESGHGRENSKRKTLTKIARRIAFALWQTGHPDYQPKE